jgi:hypothetical protein
MNKIEIEEIENGMMDFTNSMKEYTYKVLGQEVTMMISGRTVIVRNIPHMDEEFSLRSIPSMRMVDRADLIILIKDNGETYVAKNRWGYHGMVEYTRSNVPDMPNIPPMPKTINQG